MKKIIIYGLLLSCMSCTNRFSYFTNLNTKSFGATQAETVELYFTTDKPIKTYEAIGYVHVRIGLLQRDQSTALSRMKEKAAKNGADALLNITFLIGNTYSSSQITALAVKWK
jgi:hypothetical protein